MKELLIGLLLLSSVSAFADNKKLTVDCKAETNRGFKDRKTFVFNTSKPQNNGFVIKNRILVHVGLSHFSSDAKSLALWAGREGPDGIRMDRIDGVYWDQFNEGSTVDINLKWGLGVKMKITCDVISKSE